MIGPSIVSKRLGHAVITRYSILLAAAVLAGCAGTGPRTGQILSGAEATRAASSEPLVDYALVAVGPDTARVANAAKAPPTAFFPDGPARQVVLGIGDTVQITIVTTSDGAGFIDFANGSLAPLSSVPLPPQTIREGGTLNVPPVGRVLARGRTISSFENQLQQQLGQYLVNPAVIVELIDRQSERVTITGAVGAPGRVSLDEVDSRLIDIIAASGGLGGNPEDLTLTLTRDGISRSLPLRALFDTPSYNVRVQGGDVLSVRPPQRKLTLLGSAGGETLVFDEPKVTLADALGRSGGVLSRRTDRKSIFVYRPVPRDTLAALGVDARTFTTETVPTIFRFNFSDPGIFFVSNQFEMDDGDIIYAPASLNEEISSVVSAFSPFILPGDIVNVATD